MLLGNNSNNNSLEHTGYLWWPDLEEQKTFVSKETNYEISTWKFLSKTGSDNWQILFYYLLQWKRIHFVCWHILCQRNNATAAAKSLQSCLTLCHPIDGSPPGSPVPGILQARILEWIAISFSNAWKRKVKVKSLSCIFQKNYCLLLLI